MPTVSVITPTFNAEKYIFRTIQSVQDQTYLDWEMIIVDDCSSDSTISIVEEIAASDSRIKFFKLPKNVGAGIARNTALQKASAKFIAFLDSDDLWKPEKLQKQLDFMQQNQSYFTFSFYDCIDEDGKSLHKTVEAPRNLSYRQLFFCNFVGNLTGIYDSEFFGKIEISSIRKRQDWILWLTILKKIKTAKPVPESLAYYRVRKNSISSSKIDLVKYNYKVYRQFHALNPVFSMVSMAFFVFMQLLVKPRYTKIKSST